MASRSCLLHISWGGMSKQVKGYVITIHTYVRGRWDLASDRTSFTQPYIAVVITLSDDFLAHFFCSFSFSTRQKSDHIYLRTSFPL